MALERTIAFVGGAVWTTGYAAPRMLDVMIEGDRISRVGLPGSLVLEGAEVVDATGSVLVPGFQDAHIHMTAGGRALLTCDLSGEKTVEGVLESLRAYADRHPELPWITAAGWSRDLFPYPEGPSKELLDSVILDRPAFVMPFDHHGAWLNTRALAAANLDRDSPDPEGGMLRRDESGELTGMVEEKAVGLVRSVMTVITVAEQIDAILIAQEYAHSVGITSIQDALVGNGLGMRDSLEAYAQLLRDERLSLRLTTALWWEPSRGLDQLDELSDRRAHLESIAGPDRVIADTVKIMVDGTDVLFMDADAIREATIALDARGFSVHYHSYGDATTHWILDAVEAAIAQNGDHPRRHHIAHLFVVAEEDFARFARLGVTANVQGFWAGTEVPHDHLHQSTMTDDPQNREYPFGRLVAGGTRLAAGSDWPVTTADPLECSWAPANLLPPASDRQLIADADRLDLPTMLSAYTAGAAWVNGRSTTTGRIAVGFLADLVLLDADVFDGPAPAPVRGVWVGGRAVVLYAPNGPIEQGTSS